MEGGGNMIDKVDGYRIGSDSSYWAIQALTSIRDNLHELPKNNAEFSETEWKDLRNHNNYRHKGYAGFAFAYGGRFLEGFAKDKVGIRDYIAEAYRNACKQSPKLQNVRLINCDYKDLIIPTNSIIYCDPPYKGTKPYTNKYIKQNFNHDEFIDWCRGKAKEGHILFISEYSMPSDFKCVFEKQHSVRLNQNYRTKVTEKLFMIGGD